MYIVRVCILWDGIPARTGGSPELLNIIFIINGVSNKFALILCTVFVMLGKPTLYMYINYIVGKYFSIQCNITSYR